MGCQSNQTKKNKVFVQLWFNIKKSIHKHYRQKLAIKRKLPKCQKIDGKCDKKLIDYLNQKAKQKRNKETWYDEKAKFCIIELARSWSIPSPDGRDTYPFLEPDYKYEHLIRFEDELDAIANIVQQAEATKAEVKAWQKLEKANWDATTLL